MEIKSETGLTTKTYQDALMIRRTVFVTEQKVDLAIEIDENDPIAINYVGYLAQVPATTARIVPAKNNGWHVQRVATLKEFRHHHYGSALLNAIATDAQAQNIAYLILDAQITAIPFYQQLGYHLTERSEFLDAGIRHREMILTLHQKGQA
ncbi:GNAT family N-acetyltransferase [Lapidilactobacillus bayanensis]|uniref:GNAT family N-acetyltransferase n=1 Tax=Lapidilactobacillus bayanensis TaxID=2485998 RepID=UPI000F76AE40|nr:GNAT family N-acetyltransferase [Lapidilactobacillus bayanensis]